MRRLLTKALCAATMFAVLGDLALGIANAGSIPHYDVLKTLTIGGVGGWDYLNIDSKSHRLFVSRGSHVMVIDIVDGKVVGDIQNTAGVHGIVIDNKDGRGFISDGLSNTVTVFNLATLDTVATVNVGTKPDGIVYDWATDSVLTMNGKSNDATVIDAKTNAVKATISLGGKPEFPVSDGAGSVYVNIEDKAQIQRIDLATAAVIATWSIAPCESPSGLAMDTKSRRLFAVCDNNVLAVVNADTGKLVVTPAIGAGPDACAFDARLDLVFSPNGRDGTMTVIREDSADHYSVIQTLDTQKSARTFALDPATHILYLAAAQFNPLPADAPAHTRPVMKPDSFVIVEVGPTQK